MRFLLWDFLLSGFLDGVGMLDLFQRRRMLASLSHRSRSRGEWDRNVSILQAMVAEAIEKAGSRQWHSAPREIDCFGRLQCVAAPLTGGLLTKERRIEYAKVAY